MFDNKFEPLSRSLALVDRLTTAAELVKREGIWRQLPAALIRPDDDDDSDGNSGINQSYVCTVANCRRNSSNSEQGL